MMANFNFALDGKVDLFSLNPLEMGLRGNSFSGVR